VFILFKGMVSFCCVDGSGSSRVGLGWATEAPSSERRSFSNYRLGELKLRF